MQRSWTVIGHRQCFVIALLSLGACASEPSAWEHRACSSADALDAEAFDVSADPLELEVCGDGRIWVQNDGTASPARRLSLVVAEGEALRSEDGRPVLGTAVEQWQLDTVAVPEMVAGQRTHNVYLSLNLNPNSFGAGPFDPLDPSGSSDYQTSLTLFDAQRRPTEVQLFLCNDGGGQWSVVPMVEDTSGAIESLGRATLQFSPGGELEEMQGGTFALPNAPELAWQAHFQTPAGASLAARTTSMPGESRVNAVEQDGTASSVVAGFSLSRRGELVAYAEDGRAETVGWILDGIEGWLVSG